MDIRVADIVHKKNQNNLAYVKEVYPGRPENGFNPGETCVILYWRCNGHEGMCEADNLEVYERNGIQRALPVYGWED